MCPPHCWLKSTWKKINWNLKVQLVWVRDNKDALSGSEPPIKHLKLFRHPDESCFHHHNPSFDIIFFVAFNLLNTLLCLVLQHFQVELWSILNFIRRSKTTAVMTFCSFPKAALLLTEVLNFLQVKFCKQAFHCNNTGIGVLYRKPTFLCPWAHKKYNFPWLDYRNRCTASDHRSYCVQHSAFHSSQWHKIKGRVKNTEVLNHFAHTGINNLGLKNFLKQELLYCS